MCFKLKRVLSFVSAVVICGVSCVTSWFSVPVSAIGVFSPFNFYQLYQMLHGLLLGDGGGNSQTFGEWLEENMTQTIGSGNNKHVFLLTPGEKLEDMMSEASIRLALGAACSDGGIAGASKMKKLIDSWTEVYDTSDIGEIGSGASSSSFGQLSDDGTCYRVSFPSSDYSISNSSHSIWFLLWSDDSRPVPDSVIVNFVNLRGRLCVFCTSDSYSAWQSSKIKGIEFASDPDGNFGMILQKLAPSPVSGFSYYYAYNDYSVEFWSDYFSLLRDNGIDLVRFDGGISDYLNSFSGVKFSTSDDFIGPVYAMPAAKHLVTDTGTLSGLRLDIRTEDGTPDISAALDHAGVESVDDLVSGVAAGTIPMSQVYEDMRVVPYVLTDVETGQVVTDLNVSATDAKTKAVALDKTLSIPKDVSAADAYQVTGKTWDPEMSKYKLPLFQFFPFCLPWDIYEVLTLFDAEPVAPKFTIPVGQFFTRFSGSVDTSKAADQKAVVDLGSDSWQSTFKVIRALECAAIIIGLCLTAVLLIHGGR